MLGGDSSRRAAGMKGRGGAQRKCRLFSGRLGPDATGKIFRASPHKSGVHVAENLTGDAARSECIGSCVIGSLETEIRLAVPVRSRATRMIASAMVVSAGTLWANVTCPTGVGVPAGCRRVWMRVRATSATLSVIVRIRGQWSGQQLDCEAQNPDGTADDGKPKHRRSILGASMPGERCN